MKYEPKILLGMPVRNRGRVIGSTLSSIYQQKYPRKKIGCYFLLNDSTDNTEEILTSFQKKYREEYRFIEIEKINLGTPPDIRSRPHMMPKPIPYNRQEIYKALCQLNNMVLERLLKDDAEYLFAVDSDTLLQPDCLAKLVKARRKVITTIQAVDYQGGRILGIWRISSNGLCKRITPQEREQEKEIFEVNLIGGTWLLSREIPEKGIRYEYDGRGASVGFSERINKAGFKIYAYRDEIAYHQMDDKWQDYKAELGLEEVANLVK